MKHVTAPQPPVSFAGPRRFSAWNLLSLLTLLSCLMLLSQPAHAGRPCEPPAYDPAKTMQALEFAEKVRQTLEASGAQVALIARAGQDLSAYQLRFSHLGIIRKLPDGRWSVMHELNDCGTANSALYHEGLGNFFLDDMHRFESLLLIPSAALQNALAEQITSGHARQLHEASYNMLAFAYATRYQNSNQWGLEVLAAASDPAIQTRQQAQDWLKAQRYQPQNLRLSSMTRLGARMFRANVSFDDHPFERRMAGQIDTVSVESVEKFMQQLPVPPQVLLVRAN
ncbi:DUF2145 domain-containing protein [Undibacterium crateris]|uniref:DUF2145 domain-containing protein n=1 Tax=Undibacterium crateris TaxID=2528175 RepID=UPI00138A38DC|nr:DUF2145 domain-containing protein [Undibacterium crateris]NDI87038.1 DUF2145 domain-containing protein [Undibacterium crateris]